MNELFTYVYTAAEANFSAPIETCTTSWTCEISFKLNPPLLPVIIAVLDHKSDGTLREFSHYTDGSMV